jgi:hypothetical protein
LRVQNVFSHAYREGSRGSCSDFDRPAQFVWSLVQRSSSSCPRVELHSISQRSWTCCLVAVQYSQTWLWWMLCHTAVQPFFTQAGTQCGWSLPAPGWRLPPCHRCFVLYPAAASRHLRLTDSKGMFQKCRAVPPDATDATSSILQASLGQARGPKAEKLVSSGIARPLGLPTELSSPRTSWMPTLNASLARIPYIKTSAFIHCDAYPFPCVHPTERVKMTWNHQRGLKKSNLTPASMVPPYLVDCEKPADV